MLLSPIAVSAVAEILDADHFYRGSHATIFRACLELAGRDAPVDMITVAHELAERGELERVGGDSRIAELGALVSAAANVEHYAHIVRDQHTRRQLIHVGQEIARVGREGTLEPTEALDYAEQAVYDLVSRQEPGELRHVSETLAHTFELLDRPGGEITGTPTGLADLDRGTAGLQPGNLVCLAARPGMGKSALALQAALEAAMGNQAAAVFTLEMSAEEINQRALSVLSHVPLMRIRTRNGLTPTDRAALGTARAMLEQAPLYIDDTVSARVTDIRSRARKLKARDPSLALVIVDYVQLMIHEGRTENRNLEIAAISRGLKLLARELDVPVMVLAQLNRNVEHRADKTPMLSDLRDSGALEQDSDVVLFIHRDQPEELDTAILTLAKHRNGPTDQFTVTWLKQRATFANHTEEA